MLVRMPTAAWEELPPALPALRKDGWARLLLAGGRTRKVPHVRSASRGNARAGRERLHVLAVGPVLALRDGALVSGLPKVRVRSLLCVQLAVREMSTRGMQKMWSWS